ncbi:hypothetical protein [Paenibacillus gansuensis]|uniref:Uncharacterized protein n=1 Tax=Paenibacillus gansuensis TaxID=306542 RepID=A0ABW5P832_9BACL
MKIYSIFKIAATLFFIILVGYLLTLYFESDVKNWLRGILTVSQKDSSALINTIWQVHAGVTTLSIAILALIIGFNQQKKYGVKVLDYLLIHNRKFYKFHDELILVILLIILQYFFVAYLALAAVVLIFTISVIIIIHMLHCSLKIILFEEMVSFEIKKFLLEKCKDSIKIENKSFEDNANGKNTK